MANNEVHISLSAKLDVVLCGRNNPEMVCGPGALWAVKDAKVAICHECLTKLKDTPTSQQSAIASTPSNTGICGSPAGSDGCRKKEGE